MKPFQPTLTCGIAVLMIIINEVCSQCPESVQQESDGRAWLQRAREDQRLSGLASFLAVTLCTSLPVSVQLWSHEDGLRYRLLWSFPVPAQPMRLLGKKLKIPLPSPVSIEPGQLLGVSVEEGGVIPVLMHTSNAQLVFSEVPAEDQRIDDVYTFSDLPFPYALDLGFCSETDCPSIDALMEPEDTTIAQGQEGCILRQSHSYVHLQSGGERHSGVIRALTAYFCTSTPVWVQVWESVGGEAVQYTLVWQKLIDLTGQQFNQSWQVIPLHPEEYFVMRSGYHVGLYSPEPLAQLPVATEFSETSAMINSAPLACVHTCRTYSFDPLDFPVAFKLQWCSSSDCGEDGRDVNEASAADELCASFHSNTTGYNVVDAAVFGQKAGASPMVGAADWFVQCAAILCISLLNTLLRDHL